MPFLHHKPERSPKPRFDDRPTYAEVMWMIAVAGMGVCAVLAMAMDWIGNF